MTKKILIFFALIIWTITSYATHNRAGEIVYKHISGYTYEITIYTYCYTGTEADRDELELDCGDYTPKIILPRISKTKIDPEIYKNIYKGNHTFSGPGTFVLQMEDPNRNDGVDNIPNSVNTVFALKTILVIGTASLQNSSPILLNSSMDKAALGQKFVYNPGAYDPDGDSLSYSLAICLSEGGQEIKGYTLPPVTDTIYVDERTGDYVWDVPKRVGFYNIAMYIDEWRNGVRISRVLRDIQVEVIDTDNHTPTLNNPGDFCVIAGEDVNFKVTATDKDWGDMVTLSASGASFLVDNSPSQFKTNSPNNPVLGYFDWTTNSSHVRPAPYDVLMRAGDISGMESLATYQTSRIKVIAPAPNFQISSYSNSSISLKLDQGENKNAIGYKIYRTQKLEDTYTPGKCQSGLPSSSGYELIATITASGDTIFKDSDDGKGLQSGFVYCYRVTSIFANGAESMPSDKDCEVLTRNTVMLTHVDVLQTDENSGEIHIDWLGPDNLDQNVIKPPYQYLLFPKRGIGDYQGIFTNAYQIDGIENTNKEDKNINTVATGSTYKITFVNFDSDSNDWNQVGGASEATSVFLDAKSINSKVYLSYTAETPWKNDSFEVFRRSKGEEDFKSLGFCKAAEFVDNNVINDTTYFYKIKTYGYYSEPGLPTDIQNNSQIVSITVKDTIPPCVGQISITSNCNELFNTISWKEDTLCGTDILKYQIYFTDSKDGKLELLQEVAPDVFEYRHNMKSSMAGCYLISAVDSSKNVSRNSELTCIDLCELYRLPNIFTPNGDDRNDVYHPYPYSMVEKVDMKIYNRWGKLVFQTEDPDINFKGLDMEGKELEDGVYHYRCTVWENRISGVEQNELSGFITMFRSKFKAKK